MVQCYRAKQKALAGVEKALNDHYKKIWSYVAEYKRADPQGTYMVKVHKPVPDGPPIFLIFYVFMEALKNAWREGCRPIIGLDGCFLKGYCKGELLVAIGRDGNNQMFPIAWAQVEVENGSSWTWFVELLASDLGYSKGYSLAKKARRKEMHEEKKKKVNKSGGRMHYSLCSLEGHNKKTCKSAQMMHQTQKTTTQQSGIKNLASTSHGQVPVEKATKEPAEKATNKGKAPTVKSNNKGKSPATRPTKLHVKKSRRRESLKALAYM